MMCKLTNMTGLFSKRKRVWKGMDLILIPNSSYTKYDIHCHMVLNVTRVIFWMTLLMNK
jgi:hypothetical protein